VVEAKAATEAERGEVKERIADFEDELTRARKGAPIA
jgi:hypothetical protein